ncbi:Sfg1p [Saccharomyces cerevisiae VL3]|nr:Sfg1p [Saccharomyces cerevisiae VL3]
MTEGYNDYRNIVSPGLSFDNDCFSEHELVSPLSDISSINSTSPDVEKIDSLDPFGVDSFVWNCKPLVNKEALELHRMIHSSFPMSPLESNSDVPLLLPKLQKKVISSKQIDLQANKVRTLSPSIEAQKNQF